MAQEIDTELEERLAQLPKVVRDAIVSSDVEKRLRSLAETHKLHLDQWQVLENEVMLALLGFLPLDELQSHIKNAVGVSDEIAKALTEDISTTVFAPIRGELERMLEHPDAKPAEVNDVEAARTQVLASQTPEEQNKPVAPMVPTVAPATPPPPPGMQRVERAPISAAYKAGEPSTVRASVEDDPYREPPA